MNGITLKHLLQLTRIDLLSNECINENFETKSEIDSAQEKLNKNCAFSEQLNSEELKEEIEQFSSSKKELQTSSEAKFKVNAELSKQIEKLTRLNKNLEQNYKKKSEENIELKQSVQNLEKKVELLL